MSVKPTMQHLPGFWLESNWSDEKWQEYQERHARRGAALAERFDQWLHRLMGGIMPRWLWERREAKQWPSGTGSYDPCVDQYHWLKGAGLDYEAMMLRQEARRRRDGFMDRC